MATAHQLSVTGVVVEANETLQVTFGVPDELAETFSFIQGQYLTLICELQGERIRRSYSICSAVGEPLAVAIKRIEGGAFSCHAHEHFKPGTVVEVLPPDGQFHVPIEPDRARRYLLIAAGSGITPILSIAKTVLEREAESFVTLLYGNRRSADIIFREALLWLKNRYLTRFQWLNIFSREQQAAPVLNGRIDNRKGAELDGKLIDIRSYDEFFLCGPEGLISEVARGLRGVGVDETHIHYELFFASAEDAREAMARHKARAEAYAGLTTEMRVRHAGREVSF